MSDKYLDPKIDKKARQQLGSPEEYVSRKMAKKPHFKIQTSSN